MAQLAEIAKAKAFAMWVKNTIGSEPTVFVSKDPDRVEVQFSEQQRDQMISWLDRQLWQRDPDATLDLGMSAILVPWALRYLVPGAAATFVAGYSMKGIRNLGKRFRLW